MNVWDSRVLNQLFQTKINTFQTQNEYSTKKGQSENLQELWKRVFDAICEDFQTFNLEMNQDLRGFQSKFLASNTLSSEFWEDPYGELYEFYLQNQLIFKLSEIKIEPRSVKARIQGIFYTPSEIIRYIVQKIMHLMDKKTKNGVKVADLACGTGRFLRIWASINDHNQDQDGFSNYTYYGYDIDGTAINLARKLNKDVNMHWHEKNVLKEDIQEQFDVIVGNPPYIESRDIPDAEWDHFRNTFKTAYKRFDLAVVFLERIFQCLRPGGWAGLIITNKWLVSDYGEKIRELLLTETLIAEIVDITQIPVFREVSTYPVLLFFQKRNNSELWDSLNKIRLIYCPSRNFQIEKFQESQLLQNNFLKLPKRIIPLGLNETSLKCLILFFNQPQGVVYGLESADSPYELRDGIHTGNIRAKIIFKSEETLVSPYKRALTSRSKVERYKLTWENLWIKYDPTIIEKKNGEYASFREEWIFTTKPKLIIKLFGKSLQVAMDNEGYYVNNSLILVVKRKKPGKNNPTSWFHSIEEEYYFLLGLLNSKPISRYYNLLFGQTHVRGNYIQYYTKDLAQIPIPVVSERTISHMCGIASLAQELELLYQNPIRICPDQYEDLESQLDRRVDDLYKLLISL